MPKNDAVLAAIIGTNRKCISRCRALREPGVPSDRNPESWRKYLEESSRGPFSAQRQHGEEEEEAPKPKARERNERQAIAETMIALAECLTAGTLDLDQYFRVGTAIIEASGHAGARRKWTELCFHQLEELFDSTTDAAKEHPQMVEWLLAQAGALERPS